MYTVGLLLLGEGGCLQFKLVALGICLEEAQPESAELKVLSTFLMTVGIVISKYVLCLWSGVQKISYLAHRLWPQIHFNSRACTFVKVTDAERYTVQSFLSC